MLPKRQRITRSLFNALKKEKARVSHAPNMTLRTTLGVVDEPKFSFVVSKKAANKATKRNLLRRRGYSVVRETLGDAKPAAYMFFFKKSALTLSYQDMKEEIKSLVLQ